MRQLTPHLGRADRAAIRSLAQVGEQPGAVLTVFVNLDPTEFATPPARDTQITSLIGRLSEAIDAANLDHEARVLAQADRDRIEEVLRENTEWTQDAAGALIVCSSVADLFEILRLPKPVTPDAFVGDRPRLEPVASLLSSIEWGLFLVNRTHARVLRGTEGVYREVAEREDEIHRQHSQGGWSQSRYERAIERDVEEHLQASAARLYEEHRTRPFDHVLVATPEELWSAVQDVLHPQMRDRVAGRFEVDVEHSTNEEVAAAAAPSIAQIEADREQRTLERLAKELGRGERAVAGMDDVWRVLAEQRVEILLLHDPFGHAPAIEKALNQSADVLVVGDPEPLRSYGEIAAILRY